MAEWKEYTGSPEQIKELNRALGSSNSGVLINHNGNQIIIYDQLHGYLIDSYLICNPHSLADMICQQARTGQPVWIKVNKDSCGNRVNVIYVTTTPDWNIPNAEYSFTPFEEEV